MQNIFICSKLIKLRICNTHLDQIDKQLNPKSIRLSNTKYTHPGLEGLSDDLECLWVWGSWLCSDPPKISLGSRHTPLQQVAIQRSNEIYIFAFLEALEHARPWLSELATSFKNSKMWWINITRLENAN